MNDIIRTLQFEKEQLEARIRLLENKLESDNRQISEYDHELRQAKRLLKAAVEDINAAEACDTCEYYPVINSEWAIRVRFEEYTTVVEIDVPDEFELDWYNDGERVEGY